MSIHLHEDSALPGAVQMPAAGSEIERILDLARWAPSGDNTQPWEFEILGPERVAIRVTRKEDDVYDYNDGQGTLYSTGTLLESMRLAATRFGRALQWSYAGRQGMSHFFTVDLPHRDGITEDPLLAHITTRSVARRPYRTDRLTPDQKAILEQVVGEEFEIAWYESLGERLRTSSINARSTDIRLRLREAYFVHRRIIDWDHKFSPVGVPADAIGLDPMTLKMMRWAMVSWDRVQMVNRMGTAVPQLELDILPGIGCAAHFVLRRRDTPAPDDIAARVRAGQTIQRFWLQVTAMGLSMQPAMAPVVLGFYAMRGGLPPVTGAIKRKLEALAAKLISAEQFDPDRTVFRGRVGVSPRRVVKARSIRKPLDSLVISGQTAN